MTTYILFHAKKTHPLVPCLDGLFAAYAARLAMPTATLQPAMYGEPPSLKLVQGDTVYLLDLAYPAPVLEGWADAGGSVIVLDHHKQAMQDLQYLSDRITSTFDMKRSGAVIAWQYFHPDRPVPELFRYVQDRDIWTKELPGCDRVHLALLDETDEQSLSECLERIHALIEQFIDQPNVVMTNLLTAGAILEAEINTEIQYALRHHGTRVVMGNVVPYFRCTKKIQRWAYSDIGHALAKQYPDAPFAVVQTGGGWALRSEGDRDVAVIAKMLGGGGHKHAAGTRAELPW